MATSGTYTFSMTSNDIIKAALRLTTRYSSDDTIPVEDMTFCLQALNILCRSLVKKSLPLWCVQDVSIPLVAGISTYDVAVASGVTRPLRVLSCRLSSLTGIDTEVSLLAFTDYDKLSQKASLGRPTQAVYTPKITGASIRLYNVPDNAADTLHVVIQRPVQDFNLVTDNPDFPPEAFQVLKWALADEISLEYSTPREIRMEIKSKALALIDEFADDVQDETSITFTPSGRVS